MLHQFNSRKSSPQAMTPLPVDVAVFVEHLLDIGFFVEPIEVDDSQSVAWFKFHFSQHVINDIDVGEKKFIEFNEHSITSLTDVQDLMERLSFLRNVAGSQTLHVVEELGVVEDAHDENYASIEDAVKKGIPTKEVEIKCG
ncbi:hypothetical protein [Paraburkholderia tropica]|uniref:hypothetical protein n=1 Tax=Paraburkholderia tropica TaxID=92647 RepID=UPI003D27F974